MSQQAKERKLSQEAGVVARGSVLNLAAMVLGALLGFALTVLISRSLGPTAAGGLFELIALFTILSNALELGADTGLTRWISRARALGDLAPVRRLVLIAVIPVLVVGVFAAIAVWVAAPEIARVFLNGMAPGTGVSDVRIVAPLVPIGALSAVVLAGPRGFGRMWPFLAIQGLGQPALRLCLVLAAVVVGLGVEGTLVAWSIPVVLGLAASWLILSRLITTEVEVQVRPLTHRSAVRSTGWPRRLVLSTESAWATVVAWLRRGDNGTGRHVVVGRNPQQGRRTLAREFWRFTAPRGFAGTFQVIVLWLDVLLVGALLSRHAAGVYGAVSKLAILGTFALSATRLAIGPQLSALLARRSHAAAASLHQNATCWLVLSSWPPYILMAIFPATVLGIFGHQFTSGAVALTILSLAMMINLGTGNVTVVLLMGGKSSLSAYNALAALSVNVVLNLLLLPRIGIAGAAIAWAASIAVDNIAPVIEVWLTLGIGSFGSGYWLAVSTSAACFGITGLLVRGLMGATFPALVVAITAGVIAFAGALYAARRRLGLAGLLEVLRRGPSRTSPTSQPGHQAA